MEPLVRKSLNNKVLCDFTSALAKSFEMIAGERAEQLAFRSGRQIGKKVAMEASRETKVDRVMEILGRLFDPAQFGWKISRVEIDTRDDFAQVFVVVDHAAVRQSLDRFQLGAQKSISSLIHGFLVGCVERVIGRKCVLRFNHCAE